MSLVKPVCPICSGSGQFYTSVNGFNAAKCTFCTHVFLLSGIREETAGLYGESFYDTYMGGSGYDAAYHSGLKDEFAQKVMLLKKSLPLGSSILEIGCGPGYFAQMLEEAGFNVTGVELTEGAREYGDRHNVGFSNILSQDIFDSFWDSADKYDAVVSWAVLEHVDDVVAFFDRLVALVKPAGLILADTGLITPFREWLDTGYSDWLFPPLHLHVFSQKSLMLLAKQHKDIDSCQVFLPSAVAWGGRKHYLKVFYIFCKFFVSRIFNKKNMTQPGKLVATGLLIAKKNKS